MVGHALPTRTYRKETNAQHSHSETRIDRSLLLFLLEQDKA